MSETETHTTEPETGEQGSEDLAAMLNESPLRTGHKPSSVSMRFVSKDGAPAIQVTVRRGKNVASDVLPLMSLDEAVTSLIIAATAQGHRLEDREFIEKRRTWRDRVFGRRAK